MGKRVVRIYVCIAVVLVVLATGRAAIDIIDCPDSLDGPYDLRWQMPPVTGRQTVSLELEGTAGHPAYRLVISSSAVRWEPGVPSAAEPPVRAFLRFPRQPRVWMSIKRRPGTVAILLNHRLLCMAPAPRPIAGTVRFSMVSPGVTVTEARLLPIDPPAFGDDFMRADALETLLMSGDRWIEDPVWQAAYYRHHDPGQSPPDPSTGTPPRNPWQLSLYPHPDKTINAFRWSYTGTGPSWVVANPLLCYPHWDQYAVEVAVKPAYGSTVGLLVAYQDARNYLRFRWRAQASATTAVPRAELSAVIDGQERALAQAPTGFTPEQWYRLHIVMTWTHVNVSVDGMPLLSAENPGPIEGRMGLYAELDPTSAQPTIDAATAAMYAITDPHTGKAQPDPALQLRAIRNVTFDDVRVGPVRETADLWSHAGYARQTTGRWRSRHEMAVSSGAASRRVAVPLGTRWSLATTLGRPTEGTVSLHWSHADGTQLTWEMTPTAQQLTMLSPTGTSMILDTGATPVAVDTSHRLRIIRDGAYLACWMDAQRVLETTALTGATQDCCLTTTAAGTRVGALLWTGPPNWQPELQTLPAFTRDGYVRTWASSEADWVPAVSPNASTGLRDGAAAPWPTDEPGRYWHKGVWCHDVQLVVPVAPTYLLADQRLFLSPTRQSDHGLTLVLDKHPQGGRLRIMRGERLLAEYPFAVQDGTRLRLQRRGSLLLCATLDADGDVLEELGVVRDPAVAAGRFIGMLVTNRRLPAAAVTLTGDRVQDTFAVAPADWWVQQGIWSVMARYSCSPWWNWFGGFGAGTPAIWSKRRLEGDQSVEAYFGVKMLVLDQPEEYQRRFRDLNLTICGDGQQVLSGYTLQRATRIDAEPVTRLLRNGVVVWQSTDPAHLLPTQGQGHRHWFASRLEKMGDTLSVFLDNRLATVYTDPQPLSGGQMALWTTNNGMLVGRVNWSSER